MLCFYDLAAEGHTSLAGTSLSITQDRFSKILMVLAITLGIAGAWTLMSELASYRPERLDFSFARSKATGVASAGSSASRHREPIAVS